MPRSWNYLNIEWLNKLRSLPEVEGRTKKKKISSADFSPADQLCLNVPVHLPRALRSFSEDRQFKTMVNKQGVNRVRPSSSLISVQGLYGLQNPLQRISGNSPTWKSRPHRLLGVRQATILLTHFISRAEFMHSAFTRMPGESYRRWFRSQLLYLCYVFRALISSLISVLIHQSSLKFAAVIAHILPSLSVVCVQAHSV